MTENKKREKAADEARERFVCSPAASPPRRRSPGRPPWPSPPRRTWAARWRRCRAEGPGSRIGSSSLWGEGRLQGRKTAAAATSAKLANPTLWKSRAQRAHTWRGGRSQVDGGVRRRGGVRPRRFARGRLAALGPAPVLAGRAGRLAGGARLLPAGGGLRGVFLIVQLEERKSRAAACSSACQRRQEERKTRPSRDVIGFLTAAVVA